MLTSLIFLSIIIPILTQDNRVITTFKYSTNRVQTTIVHGHIAIKGDFPYLVSIKRSNKIDNSTSLWSNYCGGSIIHPVKVLTAAHCFELNSYYYYYHLKQLRVVAGSLDNNLIHTGVTGENNEQQWRTIKYVRMHPQFNFPVHDIAVVVIDTPFNFTKFVSPIKVARYNTDYSGNCFSAGFGETGKRKQVAKELIWAEINLMSRDQCSTLWELRMDDFVCSYSIVTDVSGGDSGGPLICIGTLDPTSKSSLLVGVVSGKNFDKTTLFTRVSAYRKWIESNHACALKNKGLVVLLLHFLYALWARVCS